MGRKPYEPTSAERERVKYMALGGVDQPVIAKVIGISVPTLEKHYRNELDTALGGTIGLAAGKLHKAIEEGQAWAICFFLKTRGRWRETDKPESDAQPLDRLKSITRRPGPTSE
jgi:hypothetical protein